MLLKPDKIYEHVNGRRYRILDLRVKVKCPTTGEWLKAVSYEHETEDYGTGDILVRSQKDFCNKFKLADKQKD